ncbi:ankyrin repeat-containing domain protein [Xylariales sp. PMI_506]|nr:ankyrin repeat-containing domain protein [Xylariales sp. PMI_506]
MHILDLPVEVLQKILYECILLRAPSRALRLKLVCPAFYEAFLTPLFQSRLLDENLGWGSERLFGWALRRYPGRFGANQLVHSYLVYRVGNATDSRFGRLFEIQQTLDSLCAETKADRDQTLSTLCWLALQTAPDWSSGWSGVGCKNKNQPPNPDLNLLSSAAYLNYTDLAKRLLQKGCCPAADDYLFGSPIFNAAWAGNKEMLCLFQESLPEFEIMITDPYNEFGWRGKAAPGAVLGAAQRGSMDILLLALHPPSSTARDFWENIQPASQKFDLISRAIARTNNIEVSNHLSRLVGGYKPYPSQVVATYAEYGNLDMVKKLLTAGLDAKADENGNPLAEAADACHDDVVDLLLEHGADPNYGKTPKAAIAGGSMKILEKLLNHGLRIERMGKRVIWQAVRLEHTAMVKLLLERNIAVSPDGYRWLLENSKAEGLDSMAHILEKWGLRRSFPLNE